MLTTLLVLLCEIFNLNNYTFGRERTVFALLFYKIKTLLFRSPEYVHTTKLGKIKGSITTTENGDYYCFEGIPYAKPPIGELRFKAPQPAEKWEGIFDARYPEQPSLQVHPVFGVKTGNEDCLILNIYTKQLPSPDNKKLRPVMFHVHGGAFIFMNSDPAFFGPEILLQEDVVLVYINYRLGVLGSLSLKDPNLGVPGNAGFKDMILALKWVQQNISDYGGDPNNVTVLGESAGGVSTHLLMLSPLSKGLMHKAIANSGTALNCWGRASSNVAQELAEATGCQSTDENVILKHLQGLSSSEILKGQRKLHKKDTFASVERYAGWVIEPPSKDAFLTKHPIDIMISGSYNQIPLVLSFVSNEGLLFELLLEISKKVTYADDPENHVPCFLNLKRGSAESIKLGREIIHHYLGTNTPSIWKNRKEMYKLLGDTCFVWGICAAARIHAKTSSQPVFFYKFSMDGNLNVLKKFIASREPGACHGEDCIYLFHPPGLAKADPKSIEGITQKRMTKLLTNFSKYGNPTPPDHQDELLPIKWIPINKDEILYLNIDKNLSIQKNPCNETMEFWDKIYKSNDVTKRIFI